MTRIAVNPRAHWQAFDRLARADEARYEAAALLLFASERRAIALAVENAVLEAKDHSLEDQARHAREFPYIEAVLLQVIAHYEPNGLFAQAWHRRFSKRIGVTVHKAVSRMRALLGINFRLSNPRVNQIIQDRAAKLVRQVSTTTQQSIRDAIATGRAEGMGMREVAKVIRTETFGDITKKRAVTIARTETVGALNAGEHESAIATGVIKSKTWLTQKDARVRDSHARQDEMTIALNDPFPNGLQFPHAPGAPAEEVINCRCTCLYSDEAAP